MPLSLQCPHCNGAVSVADHAAGSRVKCPHCEQAFLAPGVASSANSDDDWLKLDSDPVTPSPANVKAAPPNPPQPPKTKETSSPKLSDQDEALLAEFATDLDEFTAEVESVPAPHPSAPSVQPIGGAAPVPSSSPAPAKTAEQEYATDYRVKCKICGSLLYVKASQAGKTMKCGDCHSPVTVPPPPKIRPGSSVDMDEAQTFTFEEKAASSLPPDPFKKSADQLLEEASREQRDAPKPDYADTPSVKEWFKNVFGIYRDVGVLAHWIGLTLLGSIPAMFALSFDNDVLVMGLFPAGFFLGVLVVSCGFAILQSVANEEETVGDWPTLDPFAWLGQLFVAVAAASIAAVPAWALCHFTIGSQLISVAVTMFAVYAIFPFVLLSMLDMNTVMMPFSPEVARSVTKCEEAWGGFYFSSGLLFVGLFLIFSAVTTMNPLIGAAIAIAAAIGITFCYFSMIGRLAYAIGQAVNAPPMKNDIDRSRPTDVF